MARRRFRPSPDLLFRRPGWFVRMYWPAMTVLMIGATLDVVTTIRNVGLYGAQTEAHLAQRFVMHLLGPVAGTIIAKTFQVVFVVLVAGLWPPWCRWIMLTCGVLYSLAAVSNYFLLL